MKRPLLATLTCSLALSLAATAAEKKPKRAPGKPRTVPPQSPMIVLPPSDPADTTGAGTKLITSEMSGQDLRFFTAATEAGSLQGYLVDLLRSRAESDAIKALGGALASTQEQENKQIARLAAAKGWTISTQPTAAQIALGEELAKQPGSHFDKAVMDKVIAASEQSVVAYEAASKSADRDIQTFAQQMLPLAQEKWRLAQKMTGAGKAAAPLFRTGAPTPSAPATPTPAGAAPAGAKPSAKSKPATPARSTPGPVAPPITR